MKDVEGIKGLDVISPTRFSIIDSEGNIDNKGDINYVNGIKMGIKFGH